MKRLLLAFVFFSCTLGLRAQTITFFDQNTSAPIAGVRLNSTGFSNYSNQLGQVDISALADTGHVTIQHVGYHGVAFYAGELRLLKKVWLSKKSVEMNEFVVSASRFREPRRNVGQQVETLSSYDIENMNQPTTAELLAQSGEVFVQKSQLGGGSPVMRGFEASRVLIVVDGVRMNNAIFRAGHLQNVLRVDQNALNRAELSFGPGSVMYGSDALGGVMHFYTKDPLLAYGDKRFRYAGNAFLRYGSAMNEATGHVDVSLASRRFGSITSVTFSRFGDLMQGNIRRPELGSTWDRPFYVQRINGQDSVVQNPNTNKQVGTGYRQYDILQKFVFQQDRRSKHTLNLQYSGSSNVNRYDRLTEVDGAGTPKSAEWYYGPEKRLMASYQYDYSAVPGRFGSANKVNLVVAYQNMEESRHNRNFGSANRTSRIENVQVGTVNLNLRRLVARRHQLGYGLEGTFNYVKSKAFRTNVNDGSTSNTATTRYPGGGSMMYSAAAYLTHTWLISDKWTLSEGIRSSYVGLDARFNDTVNIQLPFDRATQQNYALNGNLSLIYQPGHDWRLALVGSTGFRSPNVDDLSKVFDSQPGSVIVPNPSIRPEYTANVDLNLSKTFYGKVRVEAIGYFTWLWDAIVIQNATFNGQDSILYDGVMSRVTANVNANHGYIAGASFNVQADINKYFALEGNLGYTYGRVSIGKLWVPLDHIPPVYGRLAAILKLKRFRGEFYTLFNGRKWLKDYGGGEDNLQYATPNGTPGWYTLNLRGSYSVNQYLQVQLGLENLLDARYRYFASGVSAPGRNVTATLRTRF